MKTNAVIFDAFGTLVEIQQPTHPFRQLLREGRRQGRLPRADDIRAIMTRCLSLSEAALYFGIKISPEYFVIPATGIDHSWYVPCPW